MAVNEKQSPPLIADLLKDPVDDEMLETITDGVENRRHAGASARRRWRTPMMAAAALLILIGGVLAWWLSTAPRSSETSPEGGPLQLASGGQFSRLSAPGGDEAATVELDDGSVIEASPGTTIRVVENTATSLLLELGLGRATFSVEPGGPRRWTIDAGRATVEVVGTLFTVERSDRGVEVWVERGRVRVLSDLLEGGVRELTAGQSVAAFGVESRRLDIDGGPIECAIDAVDGGADGGPGVATVDGGRPQRGGGARWRRIARDGDYRRAYELLGSERLRRETDRARDIEQLMLLADVARLSGHPQEAVEPLERAMTRYSSSSRAAVAAFTLGRLESDVLRRQGRAVRAFETCLRLGAAGALHEDASARLAEAHARDGNFAAARAAAEAYLERYPEGRRAERLRRWVEPR